MDVPEQALSSDELAYLSQFQEKDLHLTEIWELMDRAWESAGAGYAETDKEALSNFYASPVWLLNGIFSECDTDSKHHRDDIANWLAERAFDTIVDYGGGFGSLARKIAARCPDTQVQVVEPFPRKLALALSEDFPNLTFVPTLSRYADCVIAQDVLEHIADPLGIFGQLLVHVKVGGYVITANCFFPVIKCHLPQTFHFRHTFRHIVPSLGCRYVGTIPGVGHAQIFQKSDSEPDWYKARRQERLSKRIAPLVHPVVEPAKVLVRPLWRMFRGLNCT